MATRLMIRGFPSWIERSDRDSFFRHFGATHVTVFTRGCMRNSIFASYDTQDSARMALYKLHQLEVFGSRLVVQFVSQRQEAAAQSEDNKDKWECNALDQKTSDTAVSSSVTAKFKAVSTESSLAQVEGLLYAYPSATPTVLLNIANALASVPKFYDQVLHLMNRMNLPPPFGPPTPFPPLLQADPVPPERDGEGEGVASSSGDEEWELESEGEEGRKGVKRHKKPHRTSAAVKRRKVTFQQIKHLVSKEKAQEGSLTTPTSINPLPAPPTLVKKIELNIPTDLPVAVETPSVGALEVTVGNFGQIPARSVKGDAELAGGGMDGDDGGGEREVITMSEIVAKRLSKSELQEHSIFKNYSPGQPSMRLYIKNLAKQVTEKDLKYVFGRYVDWTQEAHVNAFDVRLMQTGRMKGQAFVGLPNEQLAKQATEELNGLVLSGKPIVVVFARSTKPKEVES